MTPGQTDALGSHHRQTSHQQGHSRTLISLNEPEVVYDPANVSDLQDIPIMAGCDPDAMLWQEQALKTRTYTSNITPILTRKGYQYQTT